MPTKVFWTSLNPISRSNSTGPAKREQGSHSLTCLWSGWRSPGAPRALWVSSFLFLCPGFTYRNILLQCRGCSARVPWAEGTSSFMQAGTPPPSAPSSSRFLGPGGPAEPQVLWSMWDSALGTSCFLQVNVNWLLRWIVLATRNR